MRSVLKWVGGKRQLFPYLKEMIPREFLVYHEVFLGGGAMLFEICPTNAVVNDLNTELIDLYKTIKNNPKILMNKVDHMHKMLKEDENYYYKVRALDRIPGLENLNMSFRSARMLFLNKTGYNGMYRVNRSNQNNVPYGKKIPVSIYDRANVMEVSNYFRNNNIKFLNVDFKQAMLIPEKGDFVYLDPPYDPISTTASFTSYQQDGFSQKDQIELRDKCIELHNKGVYFMMSNSDTQNIRNLYKGFKIDVVYAKRSINSDGQGRGEVPELVIRNYENRGEDNDKETVFINYLG